MVVSEPRRSALRSADFVIIGSGFAACVLAIVLQRMGKQCLILEAHQHPRFAIGESSTPIADQILLDLAREFSLPELRRLGRWGTARHVPGVQVGCKRGFSYFFHQTSAVEGPSEDPPSPPMLLVPASPDQASADSHWHRGSVDHYLARAAVARGASLCQQTRVTGLARVGPQWQITAHGPIADSGRLETWQVQGDFLIDASGAAEVVAGWLPDARSEPAGPTAWAPAANWKFATDSGAMFGHFALPVDWSRQWSCWGLETERFSFPPQQAALHQVTEDGWLWHLGFDHDVVSLGWVLPSAIWRSLGDRPSPAQKMEWWQAQWRRYPRLAELYQGARLVDPPGGLGLLPRLQRFQPRSTGDGWLALPNTAGFVDPLHSSGIAHSLFSVQKIVRTLQRHGRLDDRFLREYAGRLSTEFWLLDQLISLAYLSGGDPQKWEAATMAYFAAAIAAEEYRSQGRRPARGDSGCSTDPAEYADVPWQGPDFLWADRPDWLERVARARGLLSRGKPPAAGWLVAMADILGPMNTAGLCDPKLQGIYHYTTAQK